MSTMSTVLTSGISSSLCALLTTGRLQPSAISRSHDEYRMVDRMWCPLEGQAINDGLDFNPCVTMREFPAFRRKTGESQASSTERVGLQESIPYSRFPVPDRLTLPKDMQERMEKFEQKAGIVPNLFRAMSYRPDEFRAIASYYDAIMERESDSLTRAEKELIAVVTSAANKCLYCVVAHGAMHRMCSPNKSVADQAATNLESVTLTDRERAIVKFSLDICHCKDPSDEELQALSEYGLSKDDVWDIGAVAAFFALANRMANLTAVRPDGQFLLDGPGRVEEDKTE